MEKAMYASFNFFKNPSIPTNIRLMVLKSVLIPIGTYGGELFGMSEQRCKPIQRVADNALRIIANVGKSAPMHRIRQEMGVISINTRASDLRERAYFKYPTLRTWISDLVKQPIRSQTSTWVTGTARWMKRYCQTVGRGNAVKALQHRYTVNDKTKISAWIKAHNMRNTGSWMDLQMRHPDIKLGLQEIGKIRMGCYWTAQRLAKAGLFPKMYIERCPFCNKNTPETIEHMLIECFRWNSIRHETTIFNIPRLYRTVTIDQSTNNQALNQGRNIMVGKLLGGESKETRSLLAQSRDRYSPYMKELETGRFMNGIRVVRTLILDRSVYNDDIHRYISRMLSKFFRI
ncbi:hypothetical protein BB560_005690 [Smittium megazygosporum]|uniref:Reverse transcriptase zinc-binding domain-containing protein n=1 Tax=Smittium megazygosporum TaxID=133381 RepID=A0A2T9Z158_9FUNG|nr:hypothetical protein BB560_005690 [Smittium megazygosporum]